MTEIKKSNERLERKQITDALTSIESDIDAIESAIAGAVVGAPNQQVYESGSGNWTFPSGMVGDFVLVTIVGGGASGGVDSTSSRGGGGGGGGEVLWRVPVFVNNLDNASIAYVCGPGGAAVSAGAGNNGGSSVFAHLAAEGGDAGETDQGGAGAGTTGGAASGTNHDGYDGGVEVVVPNQIQYGGASGGSGDLSGYDGGDTIFALGGNQHSSEVNGGGGASLGKGGQQGPATTDKAPERGAGGAGGVNGGADSQAGADGVIIIEYWTA